MQLLLVIFFLILEHLILKPFIVRLHVIVVTILVAENSGIAYYAVAIAIAI